MNPFHKLRDLVLWVLGDDLSSPKPKKSDDEPRVTKPPQRKPPARGDGFEAPPRARVPLDPPPAPEKREQVITTTNFDASLDDLKHVVDEPMEPQPEFIPEGGMSTQSLMQEFESLDAETQARAVDEHAKAMVAEAAEAMPAEIPSPAPAGEGQGEGQSVDASKIAPPWLIPATTAAPRPPAVVPSAAMSTESLMSEHEPVTPEVEEAGAPIPSPAPAGEGQGEGKSVDASKIAPPWLIPATTAAPRPRVAVPSAAMSTESLMSEHESVTPEAQDPSTPFVLPRGAMATESLMSEFDALTPETQAAAVEVEAQKQLEREQAERVRAASAFDEARGVVVRDEFEAAPSSQMLETSMPAPLRAQMLETRSTPTGDQRAEPKPDVRSIAPPWLVPATTAAPKPQVSAPTSGLSTESLMSEFELLTPETQAAAVELETQKRLAREAAERARAAAVDEAPGDEVRDAFVPAPNARPLDTAQPTTSDDTSPATKSPPSTQPTTSDDTSPATKSPPSTQPRDTSDARSIAPRKLVPATTAAPRSRVAAPSMPTESLMSEFEALTPETQAEAVELEEQKRLAREAAEAVEDALSHPDPVPEGEGGNDDE